MAHPTDKKRKRQSNGVDTPSKKVAIDGSGTIAVTHVDDNGLHPVLVSAPGMNAPKVAFKGYSKARSSKKAASSQDILKPATHELLLQSSQHPRLDYTAATSTVDPHLSHYVAVFDPATKQLEVTPAHHLSLRSTLRSEAAEVEQENLSYSRQREALGREFGTKKAKKAIASKTENAITNPNDTKGKGKATDVQTAILDSVADTATGPGAQTAEQQADALLAAKPIPKPNLHAESVEEVYPLSTLIPAQDAQKVPIKDWQDKIQAEEEIQFKHRFPAGRVAAAVSSEDVDRQKALRYLTLLLEFYDSLANGGRSAAKKVPKKEVFAKKLADWPPALVSSVRTRFTNDSGSELGKWQLDNLCTHICALSLYVDGWTTDTTHLKEDLKLETKVISQYFVELGCKVTAPNEGDKTRLGLGKAQAAVTRMAKLKLPLEFPKARMGRRK
ncbi:related to DNA-directed RNA polymerase A (I) chain [Ramularia collo-cygni]|uniref:Related to DNA-directed RNA polymerase A (I) chain n=1 Tax=Ramularia collo-cygni TaxID=112498 RepID=A0A2D3VA00_9PEZI|nr:related to DNA-directed RNA polymerase A (I) chain [Ramularia collo-cygni]CZT21597.1 related to DNA-directed RNA polymerase A (I) chain [Ramularia collo-cygni]